MVVNSSGGNGFLYFIVGGLVVVVGLGAFLYSGGYIGGHGTRTTTEHSIAAAPGHALGLTTTTTTEKTKP